METEELLLQEPFNETDIKVVFDPEIPKASIAKTYISEENNENLEYDTIKSEGYDVPIILLNQLVLDISSINSFKLDYYDFIPKLELIVDDPKNEIQYIGGPGLNNIVYIVLCPKVDGVYRSISLPFYIKDRINETTDQIKYICEFHNLGLADIKSMQVGKEKLTTYEFFSEVAKMLGFGFATSKNCENISDKRYRQSYSQRYIDFIQEQLNISGVDETSILDAWIDTHGYINLVNVSWVFEQDVKAENLTIVIDPRTGSTVKTNEDEVKKPFEVQRTIIEYEQYPFSSLRISKKYNNLNTNKTTNSGTDASFWILTSVGDENVLEQQDIQMEENSLEGKDNSAYKFRKSIFLGCEMSDEPYMIQEQIRKRWLEKRRSKQLIVELVSPNYGLERGTLVNVGIMETDPVKMRTISQNFKNTIEETKKNDGEMNIDNNAEPLNINTVTDGNLAIVNPALSGMYYIDGMRFVYNKNVGKVIQILYLLKKSEDNNLFHAKATVNITEEQKDLKNSL